MTVTSCGTVLNAACSPPSGGDRLHGQGKLVEAVTTSRAGFSLGVSLDEGHVLSVLTLLRIECVCTENKWFCKVFV